MFCYLNLSRRLELVVARAAGISAWQFIAPALVIATLLGLATTTIYNPLSATLRERSTRLEAELFGSEATFRTTGGIGFWVRQRSDDGQAIINAKTSQQQGMQLGGVSVFRFDANGSFRDRIEAKSATLERGYWRLEEARFYASGAATIDRDSFRLATTLTPAQVGESFATPETVPFWQLSSYIEAAENAGLAAAGYRLAILSAARAAVLSRSHGPACRLGQPAFLSHGRRAEGRHRRRRGRLSALRHGEDLPAT